MLVRCKCRFPNRIDPETIMLVRFFIDRPVLAWVISARHPHDGGHCRGPLADRPVPGNHAADGASDGQLSRGQCTDHRRHSGRADRAAGQRRGENALHGVAEQQRRLVRPRRDFRRGHRSEHGPSAGAEPRCHRPADPARHGQSHRRDRQEAVAGHPADRQSVFRRQSRHQASRITTSST